MIIFIAALLLMLADSGAAAPCDQYPPLDRWFRDDSDTIMAPEVAAVFQEQANPWAVPLIPDFEGDNNVGMFYTQHYAGFLNNGDSMNMIGKMGPDGKFHAINSSIVVNDVNRSDYGGIDSHGLAILDIDRDGYLDMYIATGGGRGVGRGLSYSSVLFWGSAGGAHEQFHITGGVEAALAAGLENDGGDGRGRNLLFADFNNDGLLDVLVINILRNDNVNSPSRIYYNNGDRTFTADPYFQEYINAAIYSDIRGQSAAAGHLIFQRGQCMRDGQNGTDWVKFCSRREEFSFAVFKYDTSTRRMKKFREVTAAEVGIKIRINNLQAFDLNGDKRADFIATTAHTVYFFYSGIQNYLISNRGFDEHISFPPNFVISAMHDYNLDGRLDLLVVHKAGATAINMFMYTVNPAATAAPYLMKVQETATPFPMIRGNCDLVDCGRLLDIAAVDYNSDGLADVTMTAGFPYFLTNQFVKNNPVSRCDKLRFIAVKLRGISPINEYGIGSIIYLVVKNMGPNADEIATMVRTVNTFSHGSTEYGGAVDSRYIFGLGTTGVPVSVAVVWPDGSKTRTSSRRQLKAHINKMGNPYVVVH